MKSMDTRRKRRAGSSLNASESEQYIARRTRVHAQRKFAQPNGVASPPKEYKDLRDKLNGDHERSRVASAANNGASAESSRPKTEDFLTFLCFRGTGLLPKELEHFEVPQYVDGESRADSPVRDEKPKYVPRKKLEEPERPPSVLTKESVRRNLRDFEEVQTSKHRVTRSSASLTPAPSFLSSPSSIESSPEVKPKRLLARKELLLKKAMMIKSKNKLAQARHKKMQLRKAKSEPSRTTRSKLVASMKSPIMPCRKTVKSSFVAKKKDSICRMLKRLGGTLIEREPLSKTRSHKPTAGVKVEKSTQKRKYRDLKKKNDFKIKTEPNDASYDLFDASKVKLKKDMDSTCKRPSIQSRRASLRSTGSTDLKVNGDDSPLRSGSDSHFSSFDEEISPPVTRLTNQRPKILDSASGSPRPCRKTKKAAEFFMQIVSEKLAKEERGDHSSNSVDDLSDGDQIELNRKESNLKCKDKIGGTSKHIAKKSRGKSVDTLTDKRELRSSTDKKVQESPVRSQSVCSPKVSPRSPRRSTMSSGSPPCKKMAGLSSVSQMSFPYQTPKENLRNFKFKREECTQSLIPISEGSASCANIVASTSKSVVESKPTNESKLPKLSMTTRRHSDDASNSTKLLKKSPRRKSSSDNIGTVNTDLNFEPSKSPCGIVRNNLEKVLEKTPKVDHSPSPLSNFSEDSNSRTSSPVAMKKNSGKKLNDVVKNLQEKKLAEAKTHFKVIKSKKADSSPKQVSPGKTVKSAPSLHQSDSKNTEHVPPSPSVSAPVSQGINVSITSISAPTKVTTNHSIASTLLQVPTLSNIKSPITLLAPGLTLQKNPKSSNAYNSSAQSTTTRTETVPKSKQILIAPKPCKNQQLHNKNVPLMSKQFPKQISIAPKGSASHGGIQNSNPMISPSMGLVTGVPHVTLQQGVQSVQLPQVQSLQALGSNYQAIGGVTTAIQGVMPQTVALNQLGTPTSTAKIITQPVFVSSSIPMGGFDLTNQLQGGLNRIKNPLITPASSPLVTLGGVSTNSLIPSFLSCQQGQQPQFLTVNMMPMANQLSVGSPQALSTNSQFRPIICSQALPCIKTVPITTSSKVTESLKTEPSTTLPVTPVSKNPVTPVCKENIPLALSKQSEGSKISSSSPVTSPIKPDPFRDKQNTIEQKLRPCTNTTLVEPSPALSLALSKLYPLNENAGCSKSSVMSSVSINAHLYTTATVSITETDNSVSRQKAVTQVSQSSPPYLLSTTASEPKKSSNDEKLSVVTPTRKVKRDPVRRLSQDVVSPIKTNLLSAISDMGNSSRAKDAETHLNVETLHSSEWQKQNSKLASSDVSPMANGKIFGNKHDSNSTASVVNGCSEIVKCKKETQKKTLFKTKNQKDLKASDAFSVLNESSVYAFEPDLEPKLEMSKQFISRIKKAQSSFLKSDSETSVSSNTVVTSTVISTVSNSAKITTTSTISPVTSVSKNSSVPSDKTPKLSNVISSYEVESLMKLGVSSCSSADEDSPDDDEAPLEIVSMTPIYSVPLALEQPSKTVFTPEKKGPGRSQVPCNMAKFVPKYGSRPQSVPNKRKTVLRVPMCKSPENRSLISPHSASLASISSSLSLLSNTPSQSSASTTVTKPISPKPKRPVKLPDTPVSPKKDNNLKRKVASADTPGEESKKSPVQSASIAIQCDLEESSNDDSAKANESGTQTEGPSKFPLPPSASPFYYLPLAMATLGDKLPAQLVQQMLAKTQGFVGVTEAGMILQQAAQLAQQYHKNSDADSSSISPSAKPIALKSGNIVLQNALKASLSSTQGNSNISTTEPANPKVDADNKSPAKTKSVDKETEKTEDESDKEETKPVRRAKRRKEDSSVTKNQKKPKMEDRDNEVMRSPLKPLRKSKPEEVIKRRSGRSTTLASTKATEFDMHEAVEIKRSRRARRAAVALSKDDDWSSGGENPLSGTVSPDSLRGWPCSRLTSPTPSQSSEGTTSSTPSYRGWTSTPQSRKQSPAGCSDGRKLPWSGSSQNLTMDPVIEPRVVQVKENEKLTRAPSFFPSEEEFNEPLDYIEKIRPEAEQFGVCRIVPPNSFKPDCSVNDDMRFTAYQQYINRVMHRWGHNVKVLSAIKKCLYKQNIELSSMPLIGGVELDLVYMYEIVEKLGGLMTVIEKELWSKVADMMRIPRSAQDRLSKLDRIYCKYLLPYAMLSEDERETVLDEVTLNAQSDQKASAKTSSDSDDEDEEDSYDFVVKGKSTSLSAFYRVSRNIASQWQPDPDDLDLDERYWQLVKERDRHVCVHTASIDTAEHGYGFPCKNSPSSKHPWNLKNICQNPASILRSMQNVIGVSAPTLHIGMMFSTVCWYRDPHSLPWLEYLHTGACKIWYGVASTQEDKMRLALKKLVPDFVKDSRVWLPSDTTMVPPELLVDEGIRVCRIVQEPGQFVVVFPGAFTSSVCSGYLISESAFYAKPQYFDRAVCSFKMLRECCEPAMFSLERLALSVAIDNKASSDSLLKARSFVVDLVHKEKKQREILKDIGVNVTERFSVSSNKKKKGRFVDEDDETLCETCGQHLYVSSVVCPEEDLAYCLEHAIKLLTEEPRKLDHWKLLYSYSISELTSTLKQMDERIAQKTGKHCATKRTLGERQDSCSSNSSSNF